MQTIKFEEIESNILNQDNAELKQKGRNYIVEAAIPLLNRASQMKYFQSKLSTQEILNLLRKEIEQFEEVAEENGATYETVKAARYCLCTLLDEFAAKNGWATQEWSAHSLLVTFHNETWGGEQFFQLLDRIKTEPQKNINLIELMYYCLVLGYMGKYQVLNNGKVTVENIKKDLEKIIREYKGTTSNNLLKDSVDKKGLFIAKGKRIPLWSILVSGLAVAVLTHTFLNWKLAQQTNNVNTRINALQVQQNLPISNERVQLLAPLLKNEIDNKLIQVYEIPGKSTITILGDELFASGSDKIQDRFYPVLATVSQALNNVDGQITVSGYTDDRPISSATYPSNWHLSQGRADAVKAILLNYIRDESRVRSEGKGSDNPVVANNSPENRAKNRRVEITVYIQPGSKQLATTTGVNVQN
ncbi:type VI secretion system protein TssL, long form [Acinetobacter populi]|uniref:Cell envelope biogenesis protein OmpA n=1 Tax=Acinetobacter populi TaxID=1582270 RepID=A0A1Z9Z411_9GAMM|nr:type VI secretion system protein TssL, long form [Acinetobacter populi]OUY09194.1 cell envelope biogenesis protein OmpA [Acinetobacter populi]